MTNKKRILWITQTAIFISLLIVFQAVTLTLGNTLITGSGVNLLLILSAILCGLSSGLAVSVLSPIFAKVLGIGPLWSIIPMIIIGNIIFVLIWHYLGNTAKLKVNIARISALTAASLAKFLPPPVDHGGSRRHHGNPAPASTTAVYEYRRER